MKTHKTSLRLNTFFSFFLVIIIAFLIIFFSSHIFIDYYIEADAKQKIEVSIDTAIHILQNPIHIIPSDININDSNPMISLYMSTEYNLMRVLQGSLLTESAFVHTSGNYIIQPTPHENYQKYKISNDILSEIQKISHYSDGEIVKVNIESSTYFASLVHLPSNAIYYPNQPYLLVYIDISPYAYFAQNLYKTFLFVFTIALILTFLSSLILSERIIRSLQGLNRFASRIGSGIFDSQELNFSIVELDELARNMNYMAEKLSRSRQEQKSFFQNASHELRTPLMSIQGYAEGIKHNIFEDNNTAVDVIISESQRLSDMVEDLLTLSRLDMAASGLQHTSKTVINFIELINSIIEKMRGSVLFTDKTLSLNISSKKIFIIGNENDLFRAFENILSNAIRYAEKDIHVSANIQSKMICIKVSDDGPGIDTDLLPNIFNRFVQGKGGKHGIGLSLTHAIIKDHDGDIQAFNNELKGATVLVELPIISRITANYPRVADKLGSEDSVSDTSVLDDSTSDESESDK